LTNTLTSEADAFSVAGGFKFAGNEKNVVLFSKLANAQQNC